MGRRIPWAGGAVTGTGKKLELRLRKKYFGGGAGFSWEIGTRGDKGGSFRETAQEGAGGSEGEGCPGR